MNIYRPEDRAWDGKGESPENLARYLFEASERVINANKDRKHAYDAFLWELGHQGIDLNELKLEIEKRDAK